MTSGDDHDHSTGHGSACGHSHGAGLRGEEALTPTERRRVERQVLPLLAGSGLLALGLAYAEFVPGQAPIGAALEALGAACVAAGILRQALVGFLARPTRNLTEQLVALAILAAAATGDFVTATLVPLFLELGHLFEERTARGARAAIDGIRALSSRTARVIDSDGEHERDLTDVRAGMRVAVRPGETIPVDGRVRHGRASVDSSAITGESVFEEIGDGDAVYAGTVDIDGMLEIEVERVGDDSTLGRVIELLEKVETSKTPAIRLLERYAGVYLPLVLAVAGITLFATGDLERAIAILIVSCPCALVIAGPAAMVAALTAASRSRALIKSAEFLERATEIGTLVLDKTGTVTEGNAEIDVIEALDPNRTPDGLLALAAGCGRASLHPVSKAAVVAASRRELEIPRFDEIRESAGDGLTAVDGATHVRLGRLDWLTAQGVDTSRAPAIERPGAWLALDGELLGHLSTVDTTRGEARAVLDDLRELGLERLVLLTGDRREHAERVGRELGLDEVHAEILPEQKLELVRSEQRRAPTMMVGDGVNDALALSGADVGVAIGARVSDVALDGADVALLGGDLHALPRLIRLAARTRWVVIQNAIAGTGLSLAMMGLASVGLIGPLLGAALHNLGSLAVILNSSRLVPDDEAS